MGVMGYLYYLDYDHSGGKKYQAAHDNTIYGNNIVKITALEYPNPNYQPLCTPDNPGAEFTSPEMDVVPGVFGNAVNFTGSDYVDCGNPDEFNFGTGDWTISAWAETTNTAQQHIFANGGDGSGGIRYALGREGTNNLAWVVVDDNIKKVRVASTTGIADGVWHHLVGMRKGDEIQIYIDGELQGAATLPPGYDLSGTSQANALIGAITNFQGGYIENFFDGLIDEVHLFDRALSVAEIQQLHNTPGALGDEKVYYNGDTIDKTNPVHLLPDLSTGNNDAKINVQTCPMVYEPPYLAGANAYLGQGAVIYNNIRGYSGGSVIDEPDNFPYIGIWFGASCLRTGYQKITRMSAF